MLTQRVSQIYIEAHTTIRELAVSYPRYAQRQVWPQVLAVTTTKADLVAAQLSLASFVVHFAESSQVLVPHHDLQLREPIRSAYSTNRAIQNYTGSQSWSWQAGLALNANVSLT